MALKLKNVSKVTEKFFPWLTRFDCLYEALRRKRGQEIVAYLVSGEDWHEIDTQWGRGHPAVREFRLLTYNGVQILESDLAKDSEILVVVRPN